MSDELWRAVFAVTLDATFYGCRAAIPVMAAARWRVHHQYGVGGGRRRRRGTVRRTAPAKAAVLNLTQHRRDRGRRAQRHG